MKLERDIATIIMNWLVTDGADPTVQDCVDFAVELIAFIKGEHE